MVLPKPTVRSAIGILAASAIAVVVAIGVAGTSASRSRTDSGVPKITETLVDTQPAPSAMNTVHAAVGPMAGLTPPQEAKAVTKSIGSGEELGAKYQIYDYEAPDQTHRLVVGPVCTFFRTRVSDTELQVDLRRADKDNEVELFVAMHPSETNVVQRLKALFPESHVFSKALWNRLELYNVILEILIAGDPVYREELTNGDEMLSIRDPYAIRFTLPEQYRNRDLSGRLQLRVSYRFPYMSRNIEDYLKVTIETLLSQELKKNLVPLATPEQMQTQRIAVSENNEGRLKQMFQQSIQVLASRMPPEKRDELLKMALGLLTSVRETGAYNFEDLHRRGADIFVIGIEDRGDRFGPDRWSDALSKEIIEHDVKSLDESMQKAFKEKNVREMQNQEFYDKLSHQLQIEGKVSVKVLCFGGSAKMKYQEMNESERKQVDQRCNELRESFATEGTSKRTFEQHLRTEREGKMEKQILQNKLSTLIVYNVADLTSRVRALVGTELTEMCWQSVVCRDNYSAVTPDVISKVQAEVEDLRKGRWSCRFALEKLRSEIEKMRHDLKAQDTQNTAKWVEVEAKLKAGKTPELEAELKKLRADGTSLQIKLDACKSLINLLDESMQKAGNDRKIND